MLTNIFHMGWNHQLDYFWTSGWEKPVRGLFNLVWRSALFFPSVFVCFSGDFYTRKYHGKSPWKKNTLFWRYISSFFPGTNSANPRVFASLFPTGSYLFHRDQFFSSAVRGSARSDLFPVKQIVKRQRQECLVLLWRRVGKRFEPWKKGPWLFKGILLPSQLNDYYKMCPTKVVRKIVHKGGKYGYVCFQEGTLCLIDVRSFL